MTVRMVCRGLAIAIAAAGLVDPNVTLPSRQRPAVRIVADDGEGATAARLAAALDRAGFMRAADREDVNVLVGTSADRAPSGTVPTWAVDTNDPRPHATIASVDAPRRRLPDEAVAVRVVIDGQGLGAKPTTLVLEDEGVVVAEARHVWAAGIGRWTETLRYLPPTGAAGRLRVAIDAPSGQTADLFIPPVRGPLRTLVFGAGVSWPASFVRRALEGQPSFAVSAIERTSTRIATRAAAPPTSLDRAALAAYEVLIVGNPDALQPADLDAVRWFAEDRGGVVVLLPDQKPAGRYLDLVGVAAFDAQTLESPVPLRGSAGRLSASALIVAHALPFAAAPLASTAEGRAVAFTAPRGLGAVVFSGALDAWRFRGGAADDFSMFWRRAIAGAALRVAPRLDVTARPAIVHPGDDVRVTARVRSTELAEAATFSAGAVTGHVHTREAGDDSFMRLWPTAQPGLFEGTWRPARDGDADVSVAVGALQGDVIVRVDAAAAIARPPDRDGLSLVAAATGGQVFPADRLPALVEALSRAYPEAVTWRPRPVMRSVWWAVAFAGLLGVEWTLRRRSGHV